MRTTIKGTISSESIVASVHYCTLLCIGRFMVNIKNEPA
jgi:hypothetical protein